MSKAVPRPDPELLSFILGAHAHAMAVALTKTLCAGQAVLMREYAPVLHRLLKRAVAKRSSSSVKSYAALLESKGLVKAVRIEKLGEGRVRFAVEGCALAPSVHPLLGLSEEGELMCPVALVAMVALATERGYEGGDDIFDYVKFDRGLSLFKPNGSETIFRLT